MSVVHDARGLRICDLPEDLEDCAWCGEPAVKQVAVTLGQVENLCEDCLAEWEGDEEE